MFGALGDLIVKITADTSGFHSGLSGLAGTAAKIGGAITAAFAAISIAALVKGGIELAKVGAEVEGVTKAFDGLTKGIEGGSTKMMAALKKGSLGMISQTDLMKSFNNAAQLIGNDFAQTLPDAMKYFTKISASTGESVDYLMDSYVRGIGRMSGPILDNLKIQVTQAEATAKAAEMFGVAEDALSKYQLQMGMAAVVNEKLAESTKDLPEVMGTAAQTFAEVKARVTDLRDEIAVALLPIALEIGNKILEGLKNGSVQEAIDNIIGAVGDLIGIFEDLDTLFTATIPSALYNLTLEFNYFVYDLKTKAFEIAETIDKIAAVVSLLTGGSYVPINMEQPEWVDYFPSVNEPAFNVPDSDLFSTVTQNLTNMTGLIDENQTKWGEWGETVGETQAVFSEGLMNTNEALTTTFENTAIGLDDNASLWSSTYNDSIKTSLGTFGEWLGIFLGTTNTNTNTSFSKMGTDINTSTSSWQDTLKLKWGKWIDELIAKITGSPWSNIGANIVLGIKKGIEGNIDALLAAVALMVQQVNAELEKLWSISSPSKVMAGYGKNLVQGLVMGIENQGLAVSDALNDTIGAIGFSGSIGNKNAPVVNYYNYGIDLTDEAKAQRLLNPFIQEGIRQYG